MRQLTRVPALVASMAAMACASAARRPPIDDAIRLPRDVDRMATPMPDRPLPAYPAILLSAGVTGDVRVRYVIDASGQVVRSSLAIVSQTHDMFGWAVRRVVPSWRFSPAIVHGRRTAVRVEELFAFRAPPSEYMDFADADEVSRDMLRAAALTRDTLADGVPRTTLALAPHIPLAAGTFSPADLLAAQRAVLETLAAIANPEAEREGTAAGTVTLCVTVRSGKVADPNDTESLRRLARPGRRVVAAYDCPRTYASMVTYADSLGPTAPPGWIDPFSLVITGVEGWAIDRVRVWANLSHATWTSYYRCLARRDRTGWKATCGSHSMSIS